MSNVNNDTETTSSVNGDSRPDATNSVPQRPPLNSQGPQTGIRSFVTINIESLQNLLRDHPEIELLFKVSLKCIPFLLIIFSRTVFDHFSAILSILGLFILFCYFNNVVKGEVAEQSQRSIFVLLFCICLMAATVYLVYYFYSDILSYYGLIFIDNPMSTQALTIGNLLWTVIVNDYILKIITIAIKIIVIMLPVRCMSLIKRGKVYMFIEATSQLYRCCLPIHPWLYYLFKSDQSPKKIIGAFLSGTYMVSKSYDLMDHIDLWWMAFKKLLQNISLGTEPTKEQLTKASINCPICHDVYVKPMLMQCNHIFCEACIAKWLNTEQTCPLCRAKLVNSPGWRDGSTTNFIQFF